MPGIASGFAAMMAAKKDKAKGKGPAKPVKGKKPTPPMKAKGVKVPRGSILDSYDRHY